MLRAAPPGVDARTFAPMSPRVNAKSPHDANCRLPWRISSAIFVAMQMLPTAQDVEILAVKAGMSMRQACLKAEIDPGVFLRWKRGAGSPTLANVEKLLTVLQVAAERRRGE